MMNKRIRSMIDAIFAEMKMTAENLALRDELMANAQARFEDAIAQGRSEEDAFAEVASSLEDVQTLLKEMNAAPQNGSAQQEEAQEEAPKAPPQGGGKADAAQMDIGDALNRAFTTLGNWGQSIMPQAKKIVREMDEATGGILRDIGRAVNTGVREAQKAAGDVLDRYQQQPSHGAAKDGKSPEKMREEAKDLRAQAELKKAVGDEEGAAALEAQADALNTQADAREQLIAMEQASKAAEDDAAAQAPAQEDAKADAPQQDGAQRPIYGADGELDEDAFAQSVEQMSRDAEQIIREAGDCIDDLTRQADEVAGKAAETIRTAVYGKRDPQESEVRFPVAGLRTVCVKLDADDVKIEPADGDEIIVRWLAQNEQSAPTVSLNNHTLRISRKNPDVFKTFFSVFSKDGGEVAIFVPRGYAADYDITTTSGDIHLSAIDVDDVKISTTSGDVLLEPNVAVRSRDISIDSISGEVTVSAMAMTIDAQTVSSNLFISCDAGSVHAEGVSGDLHIEGACDNWDANTVSGNVELICTVVPTGKIEVDTLSGDATISLPQSIRGFAAEFNSMNGSLTNEFGPNRYGTCALPIHLNTLSGEMVISRL